MKARKENFSAGILMYRLRDETLEVFLVHPGGPFFRKKDAGAWSLPKGAVNTGEDPMEAARREFEEETGLRPEGEFRSIGTITQKGGKEVEAWAVEGDWPAGRPFKSNTFTIEWPPRSGKDQSFPEADRGEFFPLEIARKKINSAQALFLDRLVEMRAEP